MNYTLENFINFCDNMEIADEASLVDKVKSFFNKKKIKMEEHHTNEGSEYYAEKGEFLIGRNGDVKVCTYVNDSITRKEWDKYMVEVNSFIGSISGELITMAMNESFAKKGLDNPNPKEFLLLGVLTTTLTPYRIIVIFDNKRKGFQKNQALYLKFQRVETSKDVIANLSFGSMDAAKHVFCR